MPHLLRIALAALTVLPFSGHTQALPAARDFDSSWVIEAGGTSNLYEIELPYAVYQAASDAQLRDLAVFDGAGEPVPRILRSPAKTTSSSTIQTKPLTLFPVLAAEPQQQSAGKLMFQQSGEDTILTYEGFEPESGALTEERMLTAYVVDLTGFKHNLDQIQFEWSAATAPFIINVKVEGSSDLSSWSELGQGSIAELKLDDASVTRSSVNLLRRKSRYLRVTWDDAPDGWTLSAASGRYRENTQVRTVSRTDSRQLNSLGRDESDGGYLFDLDGAPPVNGVQLSLPADNTVIRASIYARTDVQSRWRRLGGQLFYHLKRGKAQIENDELSLPATRARLWKVVIESGRPEVTMALQLRWQPDRLRFIAQGAPPYELVAGRPEAKAESFPIEATLGDAGIFKISRVTGRAMPATLGARTQYRDSRSSVGTAPVAWRKWALWTVLVIGVLAVAAMAVRLLRQLEA